MKRSLACDWQKTKRLLHFALSIILMFLYACGSEPKTTSDTGTIAFSVTFKGAPTEEVVRYAAQVDCADAGVDEVEGKVYDENDDYLASDAWDCEDHQGTINGVLAGASRTVVILGRDSLGDIRYRGEVTGITVIAGQTSYTGTITAESCIPQLNSPLNGSVTSSPLFGWSIVTDALEYNLQVATDSSFASLAIDETTITNYYATFSFLSDGGYYWRVRAIDNYGNESAWSEVWVFTVTAGTVPSAPTNVTANPGDSEVTIGWDSVSEAASYSIYWSTSTGVSKDTYEGIIQNIYQTTYTHTGCTNGTTYYYVVTASNFYGESVESEQVDATPAKLQYSGWYNTDGSARGVYVSGNYAYVADESNGLQVIDISDPANPTWAGSYIIMGIAYDVFVSGSYAYVAYGTVGGLQILDISDPTNPTWVGDFDTDGSAQGVHVSGNYAYVADGDSGFRIIDITDPENPTIAGSYDTLGSAEGIYISGSYAYVADYDNGLHVIDISDPSVPVWAGEYIITGSAYDVFVSGSYAYVAYGTVGGLQILDISTPTNPTWVGEFNTDGSARGVFVSGNYAYVADYDYGLQMIDISDPTDPIWVEGYITTGHAYDVYISGSYAYVAYGSDSGLQVLSIQ